MAAAQIYNMLMEYPSDVTVRIDGIAASAASVIAMAGTHVCMSPVSLMMIHNPFTVAMGDTDEMRRAIQLLDEVKESILNAYEIKTGLSRARISHLMDGETWMSARKALELGFCDEILYMEHDAEQSAETDAASDACPGFVFSRKAVTNCLLHKLMAKTPKPKTVDPAVSEAARMAPVKSDARIDLGSVPEPGHGPNPNPKPDSSPNPEAESCPEPRVNAADLEKRLSLINH